MHPCVSAIIVTHNRPADILARSLNSVILQTYPNVEIVVVNSSPYSVHRSNIDYLIFDYNASATRIKYYITQKDMNGSAGRNIGTSHSVGEFVAFLDDDDEWLPNKIEEQMSAVDSETDFVYSDYYIDSHNGSLSLFSSLVDRPDDISNILGENFIGSTSVPLIRRSSLIESYGFDEDLESNQEWDLWIRLLLSGSGLRYTEEPVAVKHNGNETISSDRYKRISGFEMLIEKNINSYKNNKRQYAKALSIFSKELWTYHMPIKSVITMLKAIRLRLSS